MNDNDKVSIIVPVYNAEKYLIRCVDSIINQTYKNLEIILINDGSIDNSLEIMKKYKVIDNRIIIIDKKNEGVSIARNVGIKSSSGKYICFVDSDDYIENNMIQILDNGDIDYCSFFKTTGRKGKTFKFEIKNGVGYAYLLNKLQNINECEESG